MSLLHLLGVDDDLSFDGKDIDMVSVMNESGSCACFREEMCYPVKTEKEKTIEEMLYIVTQGGTVYDIAERFYEAGYRKVGE